MAAQNLEHLRTFLTVLRSGSLSEAARLLGSSQPTASSHVHALEQQLGFRLFVRTPSGMEPTPKALAFGREIAAHVDALEDAAELARAAETAPGLHLGGAAEYLSEVLLPRFGELQDVAGGPLHVRFGLADDLLDALRVGDLDLVVSAVRPRVKGVSATALVDEEFELVASPEVAERARRAAGAESGTEGVAEASARLSRIPVVAYAENLPIVRRYWRTVFDRRPDDLTVAAVVPDLRGIRRVVLDGVGMGVLPTYLVADDLAAGALVRLFEPVLAPINTIHLAARTGDLEHRPALRVVADAIVRIAREHG